jgi:hypothetical protein
VVQLSGAGGEGEGRARDERAEGVAEVLPEITHDGATFRLMVRGIQVVPGEYTSQPSNWFTRVTHGTNVKASIVIAIRFSVRTKLVIAQ